MKLTRIRRRETPETIIPLIDVVFFLLVFFMLIGRMDTTAPFEVTPAVAATGQDMPGGGITLSIGAQGILALDGQIGDAERIMAGIAAKMAENPATLVRVNAHKDVMLEHVLPLVARIEAAGARDIVVVVTPPPP
jgi:biopolymer transport protein ExbD